MASYKVKLDIFEGPFDLLVYLIENAEMNIYDIQVSEITSQYLAYIEQMKAMDIAVAGEFMVLAAALIEIKSKLLIPRMKAEGQEGTVEDPRSELVERILEYKRFKAAAILLEQQEEEGLRVHAKPQEDLSPYTKEPDVFLNMDLSQFVKAFNLFVQKKKKLEDIHKHYDRIERQKITLETRVSQIREMFHVNRTGRLLFWDAVGDEKTRYNIVLTFASMLEMIRQKAILVQQVVNFGEITLILKDENGAKAETEADRTVREEEPQHDQQEDDKIRI